MENIDSCRGVFSKGLPIIALMGSISGLFDPQGVYVPFSPQSVSSILAVFATAASSPPSSSSLPSSSSSRFLLFFRGLLSSSGLMIFLQDTSSKSESLSLSSGIARRCPLSTKTFPVRISTSSATPSKSFPYFSKMRSHEFLRR